MNQEKLGGFLTVLIFIIALPVMIFSFSPSFEWNLFQIIILTIFSLIGMILSLWSAFYMKSVGGFYPFDIFTFKIGHETRFLISDGPYGLCRNPMLLGFIIFHAGVLLAFLSLGGAVIFAIEIIFIIFQVKCEESHLKDIYGRDYERYMFETYRFLPIRKNKILET